MVKDSKKVEDEGKASVAPASAKATEGKKSSDSASEAGDSSAKEGKKLPGFRVGDTVKVFWRIREEGKERVQPFEGVVIAMKGSGVSRTFTVRKLASQGIGVERIFPLHSPNIQKMVVVEEGKVRRSKLYYLRRKVGKKATRIRKRTAEAKATVKADTKESA